jgi:hypothetical protein
MASEERRLLAVIVLNPCEAVQQLAMGLLDRSHDDGGAGQRQRLRVPDPLMLGMRPLALPTGFSRL